MRQAPMHAPKRSIFYSASGSNLSSRNRLRKLIRGLSSLLVLSMPMGCAAINLPSNLSNHLLGSLPNNLPLGLIQPQLKAVSLSWQVMPLSQPGAYRIAGNTDLPDQTQLTVIALRYLYPVAAAAQQLNPQPTYSILDYQATAVEQGNWQAQLDLWQVAADGKFQESWQLDQARLATRFNPTQRVVFLVTLTPIDQIAALQQQLAAKGQTLPSRAIRSADGESYVQFHQTQVIPLPNGGTQSPPLAVENFGWGRRYLIPQEPQNPTQLERPTQSLTDAPPKPEEFLR